MATFLRRDDWVTDAMGNALSGASVYVCSQPATTTSIPPSPLIQLYSDPAGADPITQPVLTDGYGHAFYYAAPGTYTVVYYSPQILETVLADQTIGSGNVNFPITVAEGGTSATNAPQALINLGAAARAANADITSLSAIPNTAISSSGYSYNDGTDAPASVGPNGLVSGTIAGEGASNFAQMGIGIGSSVGAGNGGAIILSSTDSGTVIGADGAFIGGVCQPLVLSVLGVSQLLGEVSVGPAGTNGVGVIVARGNTNNSLQLGGSVVTGPVSVMIDSGTGSAPVADTGLLGFNTNYPSQTTVGAAGGASALPATPSLYLQVVYHGTVYVLPLYAKS